MPGGRNKSIGPVQVSPLPSFGSFSLPARSGGPWRVTRYMRGGLRASPVIAAGSHKGQMLIGLRFVEEGWRGEICQAAPSWCSVADGRWASQGKKALLLFSWVGRSCNFRDTFINTKGYAFGEHFPGCRSATVWGSAHPHLPLLGPGDPHASAQLSLAGSEDSLLAVSPLQRPPSHLL